MTLPAPPAAADSFYVCRKKGQSPRWVNSSAVPGAKRDGFRCKKSMDFGGGSPAPQARKARPARKSSGSTAKPAARTAWAPKRFAGPAGERQTFEGHILEASRRYKVPANLVRAVIRVESNFHPRAISSAGAHGLMQLMPGTAKDMGVSDRFDPRQNIMGGVRYLRLLINKFNGDAKLAIAAYHAGPGIVAARGAIPYKATERYVRSVLTHYLKYRDARL